MKFEGSIKEIFAFIEGTEQAPQIKEALAGALLSMVSSDELKEVIRLLAKKEAETAIRIASRNSLDVQRVYGKPPVLTGWYAEEFQKQFAEVLTRDNLNAIIYNMVSKEMEHIRRDFAQYRDHMDERVKEEARDKVYEATAEQYAMLVANQFNKLKLEEILSRLMTQAFANMFAAAATKRTEETK